MYPSRPYSTGSLTPVLDPIQDEYEEDQEYSPALKPQSLLSEPFGLLTLDEEEETNRFQDDHYGMDNSIQILRPWPFTSHHSAPTVLNSSSRPTTPSKSSSSSQYLTPHHQIPTSSSSFNPNTPTTFLTAPTMVRAYSSPTVYSSPTILSTPATYSSPRSVSPLRSPRRVRSPLRHVSADDIYAFNSARAMSPEIPIISEDEPLEIKPKSKSHPPVTSLSATSANPSYHALTFPRPLRRRPTSPMRSIGSSRASSVPASPLLAPTGKFNESFPPDLHYSRSSTSLAASSSVPSTPTSARSRSPSISSLETIPDTPDAEQRAVEQDRVDREERKKFWDLYGAPAEAQDAATATGASTLRNGGFGSRDKRKRWSVCGAEKRSDLNLETIWED